MPNNKEINDTDMLLHVVGDAKKENYFGDIVVNFRAGEISYFRKNRVIQAEEIKLEMQKNKKT